MTSERLTAIRRRWEGHSTFDYERDINYLLATLDAVPLDVLTAAIEAEWDNAGDPGHDGWMTDPETFARKVYARLSDEASR